MFNVNTKWMLALFFFMFNLILSFSIFCYFRKVKIFRFMFWFPNDKIVVDRLIRLGKFYLFMAE